MCVCVCVCVCVGGGGGTSLIINNKKLFICILFFKK